MKVLKAKDVQELLKLVEELIEDYYEQDSKLDSHEESLIEDLERLVHTIRMDTGWAK